MKPRVHDVVFNCVEEQLEKEMTNSDEPLCSNCENYSDTWELCCYSLGDSDYDCRGRRYVKKGGRT